MATTTASAIAGRVATTAQAASRPTTAAERASRSGIWVAIFAITMSFAAFTSALFVREGTMDWSHLALPSILYVNTLILLASSGTLELSRKSMDAAWASSGATGKSGLVWLVVTLALGAAFCYGQYMAWQDLRAQGIYLATNPNSSFFYLLTFLHVLHVGAGILALLYLAAKMGLGRAPVRRSTYQNTVIYWHFLGVLWVYLLLLCRMKL